MSNDTSLRARINTARSGSASSRLLRSVAGSSAWVMLLLYVFSASARAQEIKQSPPMQRAVAAIKSLGGKVEVDETKPNQPVIGVEIHFGPEVTDDDLRNLSQLTHLRALLLRTPQMTDAGLAHLKGLANLESLYIEGASLRGDGLVHLEGMTKLRFLYLSYTKVNDAGRVWQF